MLEFLRQLDNRTDSCDQPIWSPVLSSHFSLKTELLAHPWNYNTVVFLFVLDNPQRVMVSTCSCALIKLVQKLTACIVCSCIQHMVSNHGKLENDVGMNAFYIISNFYLGQCPDKLTFSYSKSQPLFNNSAKSNSLKMFVFVDNTALRYSHLPF